jgi:hypothetical protein
MLRYRIVAPVRFMLLASLLGPVGGAALVVLILVLGFAFDVRPPTDGLDRLSDVVGFWRLLSFAPLTTLIVGLVPAVVSAMLIVAAARWRPVAFAEVVVLTGAIAVAILYFAGPPYFRDTAWIILVPVVPAAIATWLVARRVGYVVPAP